MGVDGGGETCAELGDICGRDEDGGIKIQLGRA